MKNVLQIVAVFMIIFSFQIVWADTSEFNDDAFLIDQENYNEEMSVDSNAPVLISPAAEATLKGTVRFTWSSAAPSFIFKLYDISYPHPKLIASATLSTTTVSVSSRFLHAKGCVRLYWEVCSIEGDNTLCSYKRRFWYRP